MKILIDVGHPADFHLFRNLAKKLIENGHEILFTCRKKEFILELLNNSGFRYKCFGKSYESIITKFYGLIKYDILQWITSLNFKPDLFISHGSMYSAHTSVILGKPHIALEDTFNMEQIRLYEPFTKVILTADYEHPIKKDKVIKYAGYHELTYLHPNFFIPDKDILKELNINENEKYVIIRFGAWKASHDINHTGISLANKIQGVKEFEKYAKVFISSESELPNALQKYKINIPPHKIHDAMAFASLLWAESFTMPAECSVLGVPSVINHNTKSYYLFEQEHKYGLCFNYTESDEDQLKAIEKGLEILKTPNIKGQWKIKKEKMLEEKIDVTAFLVWFVENYPESIRVMKENPDFQNRFK